MRFWKSFICSTRQPENSKRAHFRAPALQTPPKFHEKTTQRDTERAKRWREREEKARNFGPPTLRGPTLRGPTLRGLPLFRGSGPHPPFGAPPFGAPLFLGSGPPPSRAPPFGATPFGATPLGVPPFGALQGVCSSMRFRCSVFLKNRKQTLKLAKVGLAKVGHSNFGQSRSIKVGQSRSNSFGQSRFGQSRSNKDGQSRFGQSRSQRLIHTPSG